MTKEIIIVLLLIALFYYYRQSQTKEAFLGGDSGDELTQTKSANSALVSFLRNQLNSNSLEELKTKLGEKTLDELIEENEDYETEVDTLTRTKNSLEKDLTAQAEAFQARVREKDRENKKQKEELTNLEKRFQKQNESLTSEKQQHKGSLERISLLTKQVQENQVSAQEVNELREKLKFYADNLKTKEGIIEEYKQETKQLQEQKETATQDLNSILIKWTFDNKPTESASEFLEKFEKWIASCHNIEQNWVGWKDKGKKELKRLNQTVTTQEQKIKELENRKPDNPLLRNKISELQAECNKKVVSWDLEKISKLSQELSNFERERERERERESDSQRSKPFDLSKDGESGSEPTGDKTNLQSPPQEKDLENFIEWTKDYEEFNRVDWNYYRSQPDWEKAFRNWNKLRTDRIELLDQWKNNHA